MHKTMEHLTKRHFHTGAALLGRVLEHLGGFPEVAGKMDEADNIGNILAKGGGWRRPANVSAAHKRASPLDARRRVCAACFAAATTRR